MEPVTRTLCPVAVAVHTRDREKDYSWCVEAGPAQLADRVKELHRGLIADQDARPASTFVLLDQGTRLGLLIANLKTPRQDHLRTRIDDTLLLEFDAPDREAIFRLAAGLLTGEAPVIQQRLLDYAERMVQQKEGTGQATVEPLTVPLVAPVPGLNDLLMERHVGFRSNDGNQRRVAGLLHYLAGRPDCLEHPFVVVSTGFVGKDKLQQQGACGQLFIALTRSSSFPEDEGVALGPVSGEKKKDCQAAEGDRGVRDLGRAAWDVVAGGVAAGEQVVERLRYSLVRPLREELNQLRDEVAQLRGEVDQLREQLARRGQDH